MGVKLQIGYRGMEKTISVLVVEDNDDDFETICDAFHIDCTTRVVLNRAINGRKALEYLYNLADFANPADYPVPSLILLDLGLTGIGGLQLLRMLHSHRLFNAIPVVVLTASDNPIEVKRCYERGANSFLHKPDSALELIKALQLVRDYWLEYSLLPRLGGL